MVKKKTKTPNTRPALIAIITNLLFSIFEFIAGALCGSIAIMSDAVHDLGDAISICFSGYFSTRSHHAPDKSHTFGYARYVALSGFITSSIVIIGSGLMIFLAIIRLIQPVEINAPAMAIISLFGLIINALVAIGPKGTSRYLLEDAICWVIVLAGSLAIAVTGWTWLDPVMSICISAALIGTALENYRRTLDLFLEKTPAATSVDSIRFQVLSIPHVKNVHNVHIWSMDEVTLYATMHVVVDGAVVDGVLLENSVENPENIKNRIRKQLALSNIKHVTIELESELERCGDK